MVNNVFRVSNWSFDKFHDHTEMGLSFEGAVHGYYKWVFGKSHDVPFQKGSLNLISELKGTFRDAFHGKAFATFAMAHQIHFGV